MIINKSNLNTKRQYLYETLGSHSETARSWHCRDQSTHWCRNRRRGSQVVATTARAKIGAVSAATGTTVVNSKIAV